MDWRHIGEAERKNLLQANGIGAQTTPTGEEAAGSRTIDWDNFDAEALPQETVDGWFRDALSAAIAFTKNEIDAKGLLNVVAQKIGAHPYTPNTRSGKVVEEVAEAALAHAYDFYVHRNAGKGARALFNGLVARYNAQPKLATRTGQSAANQAYSTPAPLAYVLGNIANEGDRVLEPTAGTGMLLIGVPKAGEATVNQLDPLRVKLLRAAGFANVQRADAGSRLLAQGPFDVVIMNPPLASGSTPRAASPG